jgi:hypothetical protein
MHGILCLSCRCGCLPLHYLCLGRGPLDTSLEVLDLLLRTQAKYELTQGAFLDLRKGKTDREKILVELEDIFDRGLVSVLLPQTIVTRPSSKNHLLHLPTLTGLQPVHIAAGALDSAWTFETGNCQYRAAAAVIPSYRASILVSHPQSR